jgi:hypothetical protein
MILISRRWEKLVKEVHTSHCTLCCGAEATTTTTSLKLKKKKAKIMEVPSGLGAFGEHLHL